MKFSLIQGITLRDFAPDSGIVRAPGCHVSDITSAMMKKLDPKRYGKEHADDDTENWQEAGFLWEDILGNAFTARSLQKFGGSRWRPGEVELDGVTGSPDSLECGVQADDPEIVLGEYKATWKSCRLMDGPVDERGLPQDPAKVGSGLLDTKFLSYIIQMQLYCKMVGTTRARLYILCINGDYSRFVPQVKPYQIDFTQRELDEQWRSALNTARREGLL